jgi:iron complex transport system ATP-binding protein
VLRESRALAAQGYGIVLSTHDPDHAFACASAVALLHGGRLVAVERLPGGHTVCVPDLSLP